MLKRWLEKMGCGILEAESGSMGLKMCLENRPDLILMDWMLGSGPQGVEICEQLKANPQCRAIPIVIMTGAKVNFQDELSALSSGADLYLTKDQILGEEKEAEALIGYISALLRRPYKVQTYSRQEYRNQGLYLDLSEHLVKTSSGTFTNLSTLQFSVLYLLAKKYPSIVSRRYLVHSIWKSPVRDREVDVLISRLKSKIEKGGQTLIESVVGRGYRLCASPVISGQKTPQKAPAINIAEMGAPPNS